LVSANDINNKLILDRLNKLLVSKGTDAIKSKDVNSNSLPFPMEMNEKPIAVKRQTIKEIINTDNNFKINPEDFAKPTEKTTKSSKKISKENGANKVPVGQRVKDTNGKDLFMADVIIHDLSDNSVVSKVKTNALGKWQSFLSSGNYSVHISKITDPNTLHKIE